MPLRNAHRRGTAATSSSAWIWISDELLDAAFRRFTLACSTQRRLWHLQCQSTRGSEAGSQHSRSLGSSSSTHLRSRCLPTPLPHTQRRHAQNPPDAFEARRRLARRRMNHAAGGIQAGGGGLPFDPQVFLNDLWGRPKQPHWEWQAPTISLAAFEEKMRRAREASEWTRLPAWWLKGWRSPPLIVEEVLPEPEPPPVLEEDLMQNEEVLAEDDTAQVEAEVARSKIREETASATTSLEAFEARIVGIETVGGVREAYSVLADEARADARFAVLATEHLLYTWARPAESGPLIVKSIDDRSVPALISFALHTGHWGSITSRLVDMVDELSSMAIDLLTRLVDATLKKRRLFELKHHLASWNLVNMLTRRLLLSELEEIHDFPNPVPVKRFSRLLNSLPASMAEEWFMQTMRHLIHDSHTYGRETTTQLINLWMRTGHGSSAVRHAQHQPDHQLQVDLYAQLFSQYSPSEVPVALESLDDTNKCWVLAAYFLPRLHLVRGNTLDFRSQAQVLPVVREKMRDRSICLHQQRRREVQRASEASFLNWIPFEFDTLGEGWFGKPRSSTSDEIRHTFSPEPTLKDNMLGIIPYLSLLAALQHATVDRGIVTIVFKELLQVLTSLNRLSLAIDLALAAKRHLQLGFGPDIEDLMFKAALRHCEKSPQAALGLFNRARMFSTEHAGDLMESFIASPKSMLHPRQILPLFQYYEREGDPSASLPEEAQQVDSSSDLDSDHRQDQALRDQGAIRMPVSPSTTAKMPLFKSSYPPTAGPAIHPIRSEPRPLPQHRINLIHNSALHFARASRFSENTAFNCITHLYRILTQHNCPLDSRISRAFVIAGVLRPIHKGSLWKRPPRRFRFILDLVRRLEGDEVADKIDKMALRAEQREGHERAERAMEAATHARHSFTVDDGKGNVGWVSAHSRQHNEDEHVRRDENGRPVHSIKSWAKRMRRREWLAKGRPGTEEGWKEARRRIRHQNRAAGERTYDYI